MMLRDEILQVLNQCKAEIQANMAAKNINASGRSSAAWSVREEPGAFSLIYGSDERIAPLDTLEIGRPAGNVPGGFSSNLAKTGAYAGRPDVSNVFKYMLIKWAEEKGFDLNWGGATNLGRRIAYDGTLRNQSPVDVYSTPVNMAVERLKRAIRMNVLADVHKQVTTHF